MNTLTPEAGAMMEDAQKAAAYQPSTTIETPSHFPDK